MSKKPSSDGSDGPVREVTVRHRQPVRVLGIPPRDSTDLAGDGE